MGSKGNKDFAVYLVIYDLPEYISIPAMTRIIMIVKIKRINVQSIVIKVFLIVDDQEL